ncbi:MAG: M3 family metallopeptidase [Pseudobdellovibrionaceae bacterium]
MKSKSFLLFISFLSALAFAGCEKNSESTRPGGSPSPTSILRLKTTGPIQSRYEPGQVTALCEQAISEVENKLAVIANKPESLSERPLLAFENAIGDFWDQTQPLTFMGYVSTDEAVSAEGSECEQKLGQLVVDIYTRRALYQVLVSQKAESDQEARLLSQTLQSFEQNGLKLADDVLAKVKELKTKLAQKESQFSTNLNTDTSSLELTAEELKGAPADFLNRLQKTDDGKLIVTTKSTDYLAVMQNVSVAETRKKVMLAYLNRGGETNTKLLEEAVVLRSQIAQALGYKTWADYRTAPRMAKSSEAALDFLNNLKGKLAERNQKDFQQLLNFKKELQPQATALDQWDISYFSYQLQKRDYSLDQEKIREYFPANQVVAGIFEIYSKLLGVSFVEVQKADVWAEGVKLYEIHEGSSGELIGYFYTDLIPRPGKYGHAAAFPLISGRRLANGKYSLPIASMVANFNPPTADKPSLLSHDEVETFFHEFGHIMHQTLTRAPYATLSGASVAQDFVEAPSQMLENWVWSPQILNQISGHYLRPEEKLPAALLEKMLAAKNFQQGAAYTKQLLYALFDLSLHTQNQSVDVTKTYDDLYRQIIGQEPLAGNHFPASFGHLMGGYDAGYYGYLWSEVYAQDMFSQFPEADLTDHEMGSRYRKSILEPGSMKEALELLREFLGREPNADAFLKKLGI